MSRASLPNLSHYLRVVAPCLDERLFPPAARARTEWLTAQLAVCSDAVLEFRLLDGADQVDLSLCLPRDFVSIDPSLLADPWWRKLAAIGVEWMDETSLIHRCVKQLWVELDGPRAAGEMPSPIFGYALEQGAEERERLVEIAQSLLAEPLKEPLVRTLQKFQRLTPPEIWIKHIGKMAQRGGDSMRLVLSRFPARGMVDFLARFGWKDADGALQRTLDDVGPLVDYFTLSLDVLHAIGPRVSLECLLDRHGVEQGRWRPLLDYLVKRELCSPVRREAVLAWPGFSRRPADGGYWPENLRAGEAFLEPGTIGVFHRYVSLVKFSFEPGKAIEAKAYLSFAYRWLGPRRG